MNIYIDYNGETPTEEQETKMALLKDQVAEKMRPIQEDFDAAEGFIKLFLDGGVEINAQPGMKFMIADKLF